MYLIDFKENSIWEGTVLRFPGEYPYEKYVDYMVVSYPDTESGFAIYCISGYYAGKLVVCLPLEARDADNRALSTEWVSVKSIKANIPTGTLPS